MPVCADYTLVGGRVIMCFELPDTMLHCSSISQTQRENKDSRPISLELKSGFK